MNLILQQSNKNFSFPIGAVASLGKEQFLGLYISAGVISTMSSYFHKAVIKQPGLSLGAVSCICTVLFQKYLKVFPPPHIEHVKCFRFKFQNIEVHELKSDPPSLEYHIFTSVICI